MTHKITCPTWEELEQMKAEVGMEERQLTISPMLAKRLTRLQDTLFHGDHPDPASERELHPVQFEQDVYFERSDTIRFALSRGVAWLLDACSEDEIDEQYLDWARSGRN